MIQHIQKAYAAPQLGTPRDQVKLEVMRSLWIFTYLQIWKKWIVNDEK